MDGRRLVSSAVAMLAAAEERAKRDPTYKIPHHFRFEAAENERLHAVTKTGDDHGWNLSGLILYYAAGAIPSGWLKNIGYKGRDQAEIIRLRLADTNDAWRGREFGLDGMGMFEGGCYLGVQHKAHVRLSTTELGSMIVMFHRIILWNQKQLKVGESLNITSNLLFIPKYTVYSEGTEDDMAFFLEAYGMKVVVDENFETPPEKTDQLQGDKKPKPSAKIAKSAGQRSSARIARDTDLGTVEILGVSFFKFQVEMCEAVENGLDRCTLVAPPGSGKTRCGLRWICSRLKEGYVVFATAPYICHVVDNLVAVFLELFFNPMYPDYAGDQKKTNVMKHMVVLAGNDLHFLGAGRRIPDECSESGTSSASDVKFEALVAKVDQLMKLYEAGVRFFPSTEASSILQFFFLLRLRSEFPDQKIALMRDEADWAGTVLATSALQKMPELTVNLNKDKTLKSIAASGMAPTKISHAKCIGYLVTMLCDRALAMTASPSATLISYMPVQWRMTFSEALENKVICDFEFVTPTLPPGLLKKAFASDALDEPAEGEARPSDDEDVVQDASSSTSPVEADEAEAEEAGEDGEETDDNCIVEEGKALVASEAHIRAAWHHKCMIEDGGVRQIVFADTVANAYKLKEGYKTSAHMYDEGLIVHVVHTHNWKDPVTGEKYPCPTSKRLEYEDEFRTKSTLEERTIDDPDNPGKKIKQHRFVRIILINVRIYDRCKDFPMCDGVFLAYPPKLGGSNVFDTMRTEYQRCGRALRWLLGKMARLYVFSHQDSQFMSCLVWYMHKEHCDNTTFLSGRVRMSGFNHDRTHNPPVRRQMARATAELQKTLEGVLLGKTNPLTHSTLPLQHAEPLKVALADVDPADKETHGRYKKPKLPPKTDPTFKAAKSLVSFIHAMVQGTHLVKMATFLEGAWTPEALYTVLKGNTGKHATLDESARNMQLLKAHITDTITLSDDKTFFLNLTAVFGRRSAVWYLWNNCVVGVTGKKNSWKQYVTLLTQLKTHPGWENVSEGDLVRIAAENSTAAVARTISQKKRDADRKVFEDGLDATLEESAKRQKIADYDAQEQKKKQAALRKRERRARAAAARAAAVADAEPSTAPAAAGTSGAPSPAPPPDPMSDE